MYIRKALFLLAYFLGCISTSQSQNLVFKSSDERINIAGQVKYYVDSEYNTIGNIVQRDFSSNTDNDINFGYTDDVYWFKFDLKSEQTEQELLIDINFVNLDSVELFFEEEGEWKSYIAGDKVNFDKRVISQRTFVFPIQTTQEAKTFYLRVSTSGTLSLPLYLSTEEAHINHYLVTEIGYGFLYGIMLIMALYNLFLFIPLKDADYLLYFLTNTCTTLLQASVYGHTVAYLWGHDWVWWNNYSIPVFIFATYFCAGLFVINFLNLKAYNIFIFRIVQTVVASSFVLAGITFFFNYSAILWFSTVFAFVCVLIYMVAGFVIWWMGNKFARFLILAWLVYMIGALCLILYRWDFMPYNFFAEHGLKIGAILEVLLLSFAIADKIGTIKKEKQSAQLLALEQLKENQNIISNQNERLEAIVKERIQDLEVLNLELVEKNEALQESNSKLDSQSKELKELNDTKSQLFAIIGHDLRSPINSLQGLLSLIDAGALDEGQFQAFSERLKISVEYVRFTLYNLLHWANSQMHGIKTVPQSVKLFDIVEKNRQLSKELAASKDIQIINNVGAEMVVFADPDQLKLVLRNLISNARKFTPRGGEVIISAEVEHEYCQVVISDNGIGMSQEKAKSIFKEVGQLSSRGTEGEKGTGLGLQLCKEFIEKNGGKIWVESKINEGSNFYFTLPLPQKIKSLLES